jgi:serine/threonine protein kinase
MNTAESSPETEDDPLVQVCATCGAAIDISEEEPLARITCPACGAAETVSGQVDKFELQSVVGRGGMGVVYRAYDRGLERFVALKLMRRDQSNANVIEQLQKEAVVTASINHPHVVRVFTSGTDHRRFFIAMELVDKGTLDDLIHLQGRVAETQVLEVGIQIAQGLRAAQQAGLIHRDVKPGNILFADAHTAKIVDFGLAIFAADEESQRGEVWGTPYYVAPEKLEHLPEDFRSDMYSLGGTLFHALAGRPPFEAENASLVALKHLKSEAVSLQAFAPHVSGETAYVINRTLSKDPNARYQSYDELIEHLEYALEQLKAHGGQPQPKQRVVLEDDAQQKAMGWITVAMIALILVISVTLFVFRKKIFRADETAAASPAPSETQNATHRPSPFPEALKKLVEDDTAGAIALFHQQGANSKLPPLQQAWANFGEGLAHLVAGNMEAARVPLQAVIDRPQFKTKAEDEKIDTFLRNLARELVVSKPHPPTDAAGLDENSYPALTMFAYGVKDWALHSFKDSTTLLRLFRKTDPKGSFAWITELRQVATNVIENGEQYMMATEALKKAKRPELYAKALVEMRKIKGPLASLAEEFAKTVPTPKPVALPKLGEWSQAELGTPEILPSASVDAAGAFTIKAGGADLWGNADSGLFIQRALEGDGEIVAHVASLSKSDPGAKAGVMLRESLKADARNVAVVVQAGGGISQQSRVKNGNATSAEKANGGAPYWLKLVRKGDEITGFRSADNQMWSQIAVQYLEKLPARVYIGLVISAHSGSTTTTANIDSVTLHPRPN